jgi:hypothetical protein
LTPKPDCPRHRQLCAYTGSEPDRCPVCHTTWARVESCGCKDCGRSREHHLAVHEGKDAQRARAADKAARLSDRPHDPASPGGTP